MIFNSLSFLIFFPIVTIGYFLLPYHWRWLWLLLSSCMFYMALIPVYILILFLLIVIDYTMAILIENASGRKRKFYLVLSLLATCIVLFFFKYYAFVNVNLEKVAQLLHWNYALPVLNLILPIGLSFHTFQSLSYVIEVYRGKYKAERHFGIYALYVMFFPQLVAGPIERPKNLLPQFFEQHNFDYDRVTGGLKLILWGLFQKVVIADRLSLVVNRIYDNLPNYQGPALVIATIFFAFQIYCDFAGYSDIAIGSAQVLGFRLMQNFRRPYLAVSISDFWQRWHISLSTWFRDYVYIPLGGNRVSKVQWFFNILITFVLSGLWHGANWTFLAWGGLHGAYYVVSQWAQVLRDKITKVWGWKEHSGIENFISVVITFILVCFAWVFFRSQNIENASYVFSHLFLGWNKLSLVSLGGIVGVPQVEFIYDICLIVLLMGLHIFQEKMCSSDISKGELAVLQSLWAKLPGYVRWIFYVVGIWMVMNWGVVADIPFIYFQF
ncbi:MAG: MBOAT family protein [Candidatus Omnitrophica bacterium]|nr:MBOAT family protein [Candidatus Omnitrophota bacterium]